MRRSSKRSSTLCSLQSNRLRKILRKLIQHWTWNLFETLLQYTVTRLDSKDAENQPTNDKSKAQTTAEFVAELEAIDDEQQAIPNLPCFDPIVDYGQTSDEIDDYDYKELETMEGFRLLLQGLMGFEDMYSKRGMLQSMIDNEQGWDLETMKEAFGSAILG